LYFKLGVGGCNYDASTSYRLFVTVTEAAKNSIVFSLQLLRQPKQLTGFLLELQRLLVTVTQWPSKLVTSYFVRYSYIY
jgi:hypothetical protein